MERKEETNAYERKNKDSDTRVKSEAERAAQRKRLHKVFPNRFYGCV